jgi:hypothetical protein
MPGSAECEIAANLFTITGVTATLGAIADGGCLIPTSGCADDYTIYTGVSYPPTCIAICLM